MRTDKYPTQEYLRQCFRYENGRLFWKQRPVSHFVDEPHSVTWNKRFAGKEAGNSSGLKRPRWAISVNDHPCMRHILVWLYHYGILPDRDIDHKNRNQLDDRVENLREATRSQNCANTKRQRNNTSGQKGVSWNAQKSKWHAYIKKNRKRTNLGYYGCFEEAKASYLKASAALFGEFAYSG